MMMVVCIEDLNIHLCKFLPNVSYPTRLTPMPVEDDNVIYGGMGWGGLGGG